MQIFFQTPLSEHILVSSLVLISECQSASLMMLLTKRLPIHWLLAVLVALPVHACMVNIF